MSQELLERVQPIVSSLADQIAGLVTELVRERLQALLDRTDQPAAPTTRSAPRKRGGASHAGGHGCGLCGTRGHNRKTCPSRENAEPEEEPAPAAVVKPPPPPAAKQDRFARIQAAAARRDGAA